MLSRNKEMGELENKMKTITLECENKHADLELKDV